jgi:AraC family transcriptional regulator of adaptative response / DNA-3-methyladenine glycosylase II
MAPRALRQSASDRNPKGHGTDANNTLTLRLAYRPPLSFTTMLAFLSRRAIPGIERVGPKSYERMIGPADSSGWIRVTAAEDKPELLLEISFTDPRTIPDIVRRVRRVFDLDADMRAAHAVLRTDSLLAKGVRKRPGLRVPGGWDGFEIMVRAILGQQVSVASATTLARRLVEQYGSYRDHAIDGLERVFPTPEQLLHAPLEKIGLPRSRAVTLRSLAEAVLEGTLDFRAGQLLDEFVERATLLPGIGPWSAHYVAMRALNHPDAFPAGDLVVQRMLGRGERLSERETENISQSWRPWRAYAVLHLWHLSADGFK